MRIYSLLLTLLFVFVHHFSFSQEITAEQQEIMNKTISSINNYQNKQADSIYYLYIDVYPNAFDRQVESIDNTDITGWKNLESISMRARRGANPKMIHQFFEKLEPQLVTLPNIKKVSFTNLNLNELPSTIFKLKNLEVVGVTMNPIFSPTVLFSGLDSLPNLSYLHLSLCKLSYIPENIGNLKKLKKLNLSTYQLKELPVSMRFLTELEELDISQNTFVEFPYVVLELKKLKKFSLNFNSLTAEESAEIWGDGSDWENYDEEKEKVVELKEIKELLLVPSIDEAADYVAAVDSERADTGRDSYNDELEELLDFLRS